MCEAVVYGDEDYPTNSGWSAYDKPTAMAHLKALESFDFIYALVALQRSLLCLRDASVELQGKKQDSTSDVALVQECLDELRNTRGTAVDDYSHRVFQYAERIAQKSNVAVTKPRTTQRQQHHANVSVTTVEKVL